MKNMLCLLFLFVFYYGIGNALASGPLYFDKLQRELSLQPESQCSVVDSNLSGSYRGGCKDGMADGLGLAKGNDTYVGDFKDGELQGKGAYYWTDSKEIYMGDWVTGNKQGTGVFVWPNGDRFEGKFLEDARTSDGILIEATRKGVKSDYINFDKLQQELSLQPEVSCLVEDADLSGSYRGSCRAGKANGVGLAKGKDTYVGEFVDGVLSGCGAYYWSATKESYKGYWASGTKNGKGTFVWSNGSRYEGGFLEDSQSGTGTYIWANGDKYEGDYYNDKMHGQGKFTWKNGDIYQGAFVKDIRTGKGVLTWANSDRYEGDFDANKRSGKGVFIWANGYRYEGDYADDKRVLSGNDKYLNIEEPYIQKWVLNNLTNEKELPPGNWFSTDNGKFFLSSTFQDGYTIGSPTWSGAQINGHANGPGTINFHTIIWMVNVEVAVDCYMLNGSIIGKATFRDPKNRDMIKTKNVYVGNSQVMNEYEYNNFIYSRYKLGLAAEKAKDSRFGIRYAFKQGAIGTRYIPVTTNEIYNTETLFYFGNTPVTKTTSHTETEGGINEKVDGYTAVIGITNKTKDYYIVNTLVGGTFVNSEYYKHNFFLWFGKESASLSQKNNYMTISKGYLLKPNEETKDQIVVGERLPADFQIGYSDIIKVDEDWVSRLDKTLKMPTSKCINAKELIASVDSYLSDSKASIWHQKLIDKKTAAIKYINQVNIDSLRKLVVATTHIPSNYDKDFENEANITLKNDSDYYLKIILIDPMHQQRSINIRPKSVENVATTIKNQDKSDIAVKVDGIFLLNESGYEKDFNTCTTEKVPSRVSASPTKSNSNTKRRSNSSSN